MPTGLSIQQIASCIEAAGKLLSSVFWGNLTQLFSPPNSGSDLGNCLLLWFNCSGGEVTRWWSHALAACRQRRKQNVSQISGYSKRFILRGQFCFEPLKPAVRSFLLSVSCSLSQLSKGWRPVRPGQVVSSSQGQMETNNHPHSDSHL